MSNCIVCEAINFRTILYIADKSLATDGRIFNRSLVKEMCLECGLIKTANPPSAEEINRYYAEYDLGVRSSASEATFIVNDEHIGANQEIADWIINAYESLSLTLPNSFMDVGCSAGGLISCVANKISLEKHLGVDLDEHAIMAARSNGLNARVSSGEDVDEKFDLVSAVAVIEHTTSPSDFLSMLKSKTTEEGLIALILPVQDGGNRDVFFWDHLFHLHSDHVKLICQKQGLEVKYMDLNHPFHHGFGLFLLHKSFSEPMIPISDEAKNPLLHKTIGHWEKIFHNLKIWFDKQDDGVAVLGVGETFDLVSAYSSIDLNKITLGFDANPRRAESRNLPFAVESQERLNEIHGIGLIITFQPSKSLIKLLEGNKIDVFITV